MRYEFWVGARYAGFGWGARKAKKGDRFVSFIASSSMIGIALGVAALIIVLSVMNGFQTEVRDRMLSVLPHIELFSHDGKALDQWQELTQMAKEHPAVQAGAPFVTAQAMLARDSTMRGVQVNGIHPEAEPAVSDLAQQMISGELQSLE